jgi:hypothetical protein
MKNLQNLLDFFKLLQSVVNSMLDCLQASREPSLSMEIHQFPFKGRQLRKNLAFRFFIKLQILSRSFSKSSLTFKNFPSCLFHFQLIKLSIQALISHTSCHPYLTHHFPHSKVNEIDASDVHSSKNHHKSSDASSEGNKFAGSAVFAENVRQFCIN